MKQLPILGFNSGKYDINIIKNYLVTYFVYEADGLNVEEEEEIQTETKDVKQQQAFIYVVKRNNNFVFISTQKLKFLDVANYVALASRIRSTCQRIRSPKRRVSFAMGI